MPDFVKVFLLKEAQTSLVCQRPKLAKLFESSLHILLRPIPRMAHYNIWLLHSAALPLHHRQVLHLPKSPMKNTQKIRSKPSHMQEEVVLRMTAPSRIP